MSEHAHDTEAMPSGWRGAALVVRFLVEVGALLILAWWGVVVGGSLAGSLLVAILAPLVAAAVWGLVVAPRAKIRVPLPVRILVELAVFAAATAALLVVTNGVVATTYAVIAVVTTILERTGASGTATPAPTAPTTDETG